MSIRTIQCYDGKDVSDISADIVPEVPLRLYLNGKLLITIACAGIHLQELAVGFLRSEDIVTEISDMNDIRITEGDEPSVYVSTTVRRRSDQTLKTLGSSGARGKRDGNEVFERFPHPGIVLTPKHILNLMEQLEEAATIHKATRGTHCSGLADASGMLIAREDIGRHNTIDMLCGHMLMEGIKSSDKAIVTTGRVSSEIVLKVRRMGIPVIVSHSAATTGAMTLCKNLGMTLVGYVRNGKFNVYVNGNLKKDRKDSL